MFELLKKRIKNEKGLSLVELLAVIVILGIVAAIAVPAIGNIIENSRYNAVKADAINVINAANLYYTDAPKDATASVTVKQLMDNDYLDSRGKIPEDATVSRDNPRALTTKGITYTGSKNVTFSGATVDSINADDRKGSGDGGYTITGTPTGG
ncbi:type II secretion system protein [Solibacillus silvestris]|uniref:type II secretion system protein n=1 Tax=Solibacillus silvestris TaxID=76853 RepID=UPI003F81171B